MGEKPDLDALARQFLDLWEDQITALAADPKMVETTGRMLRLATPLLSSPVFSMLAKNFAHYAGKPNNQDNPTYTENNQDQKGSSSDEKSYNNRPHTESTVKNRHQNSLEIDDTPAQSEHPSSRATPFALASGVSNDDLVELKRRLTDIEKRLAALESRPSKPGRRPQKSPRKRRS